MLRWDASSVADDEDGGDGDVSRVTVELDSGPAEAVALVAQQPSEADIHQWLD